MTTKEKVFGFGVGIAFMVALLLAVFDPGMVMG